MWPCRVDRALNQLEEQPLPLQREVFDASTSLAAKALGKGLKAAAEVTLQVCTSVNLIEAVTPAFSSYFIKEEVRQL
jgi:hypothetical protein